VGEVVDFLLNKETMAQAEQIARIGEALSLRSLTQYRWLSDLRCVGPLNVQQLG
jgi:hypothetical protein